ncbi:hypothetical protein LTR35_008352 [Friedmanniomyces endolithicus]|uniref:Nitrile-specifier protein 5 n=1 Tax=Friedmanniomyces endolithicus TaxID=329885 RepID=A0AAN6FKV6_9PEZI|nr:hypothetical protein LTR35_008352 [Friedmanniomyces endolithicus]KAK0296370.1 hypothetical protein LTS00_005203 [Friedmanniomyces endolithicus]KAK0319576.1 hypothetical protein LTR82_009281 [Friedmanniomyces endolithicus]KAK1004870.1 hypothetical protein LTR54_007191 [Friedmanniomyces endolithicus]
MPRMKATWTAVNSSEQLQRSSHNVAVIDSSVYVFGGELKPRQPRDDDIFVIPIKHQDGKDTAVAKVTTSTEESRPSPRVGSAVAKLGTKLYFFSGRGGEAMAPVKEQGALWIFDTSKSDWKLESPSADQAYPEARSYHAMTCDGEKTIYVHAGCPEKGRLADLWAYDMHAKTWKELAGAPGTSRGGPSIAFAEGQLWRMNGFDGEKEVGGSVDCYDPYSNTWSSKTFDADGKAGPGARSVATLLPVKIGGKTYLVTVFGESDPSSLGHQGAGKMLSDAWAYDISADKWQQIETEVQGGGPAPAARGWFDADVIGSSSGEAIVVSGGLAEQNERLGDSWLLSFTNP